MFRGALGLSEPQFFLGNADAPALRALHLAGGLGVVGLVTATSGHTSSLRTAEIYAAIGVTTIAIFVVAFLGDPEGPLAGTTRQSSMNSRQRWHRMHCAVGRVLVIAAVSIWLTPSVDLAIRGNIQIGNKDAATFDDFARYVQYGIAVLSLGLLCSNAILSPYSQICTWTRSAHQGSFARSSPEWDHGRQRPLVFTLVRGTVRRSS